MLAALAILALCSTVLLVAFGQAARALQQVERSDRLSLAARSVLDEQGDGPLTPGRSEGQWAAGIHWQLDVRPLHRLAGGARLLRLDLTVSEAHRLAHFSTLRVLGAAR
ncbi:MAG: general secretion pathway protein GspI [Pseudomonas sp.]|nr:general secretion pathway protein GspI [Pseudomonas sp. PIA16]MDE1168095.1 general secretion pathway protein GspI [Pseudomonas sp.]